MECPSCGNKVKPHHQTCVKCGGSLSDERTGKLTPGRDVPAKEGRLANLRYLKEFVPPRDTVLGLLPHPANWVLGIGLPVLVCLALVIPMFAPSKAANAGGVAVSGLEMSQNSMRLSWSREEVDDKLAGIMKAIHKNSLDAAKAYAKSEKDVNYVNGANIAGFLKVADAMVDQGLL